MKIAFWSETEQSGTTSNMLICAAMVAILCPEAEIAVRSLAESAGRPRVKSPKAEQADFCFLDCGAGFSNRKCRILRQMDLVVVNIRQENGNLEQFFLRDRHMLTNFFILAGNYYESAQINKAYVERMYRVASEDIGVISNNSELYGAFLLGKTRHFIKSEYGNAKNMRNEKLLVELELVAKQLLKKLEGKYTGGNQLWNR